MKYRGSWSPRASSAGDGVTGQWQNKHAHVRQQRQVPSTRLTLVACDR